MKLILLIVLLFPLHCEKIEEIARNNWKKKVASKKETIQLSDIESWKEKLNITEAELKDIDEKIYKKIDTTNQKAYMAFKIGKAFLKVSQYENAIDSLNAGLELQSGKDLQNHHYEEAAAYLETGLKNSKIDKELLFDLGLAYANAAKDRGWEKTRREKAIGIFKSLARTDANDSRFPYQLALIYFDSTYSDFGLPPELANGYDDIEKSFKLLNYLIRKYPNDVSARFARANFSYKLGKKSESFEDYSAIKSILESLSAEGKLEGNLKDNPTYKNLLNNLQRLSKEM